MLKTSLVQIVIIYLCVKRFNGLDPDHVFVFLTDETRPELEKRLSVIGADLMLDVIKDLDNYRLGSKLQNEDNVTYGNGVCLSSFWVLRT